MDNNKTSSGIGFTGILALIFITLKLIGIIDWSWVWVLSPIWISFLCILLWVMVVFIVLKRRDNKLKRM